MEARTLCFKLATACGRGKEAAIYGISRAGRRTCSRRHLSLETALPHDMLGYRRRSAAVSLKKRSHAICAPQKMAAPRRSSIWVCVFTAAEARKRTWMEPYDGIGEVLLLETCDATLVWAFSTRKASAWNVTYRGRQTVSDCTRKRFP